MRTFTKTAGRVEITADTSGSPVWPQVTIVDAVSGDRVTVSVEVEDLFDLKHCATRMLSLLPYHVD